MHFVTFGSSGSDCEKERAVRTCVRGQGSCFQGKRYQRDLRFFTRNSKLLPVAFVPVAFVPVAFVSVAFAPVPFAPVAFGRDFSFKICFILSVSDFLKVAFLPFRVPGGFGCSGVLDRSAETFWWQMSRRPFLLSAKLLTCCSVGSKDLNLQTPLCLQKRIVFR